MFIKGFKKLRSSLCREPISPSLMQHGFSLVEVLISLGIGVFLILGTGKLYIHSRAVFHTQEPAGQLLENGRIVSEILSQNLGKARYWGCSGSAAHSVINHLDLDSTLKNSDGSSQGQEPPDYSQSNYQGVYGQRNQPVHGTDEITLWHALDDQILTVTDI